MRRAFCSAVLLIGVMLMAPLTSAASVEVTGVEFLPNKTITIPMKPQESAPQGEMSADVEFKHGQSRIRIKYKDMKPAILFGDDVTSYVVWALTYDGRSANLGELQVNKDYGTETFYVGLKGFALVVTAEPYYMVPRPSEMVMFIGGPPKKEKSRFNTYRFTELAAAPQAAVDSIADLQWDSDTSLELLQARKAYELAGRHDAGKYAKKAYDMAAAELKVANDFAAKNPKNKKIDSPARNAVQLSNTAINIAVRHVVSQAFKQMLAEHQAKLRTSNKRSEAAEMLAATLANQQATLRATLEEVESENIELQSLLQDALSKIATARVEAAKIVLTLPGIVFDVDTATLKPEPEMALAKLSGILMVFHRARVAIHGYTDSSGDADHNIQLSQRRAESVQALLIDQGVAVGRLTAMGHGNADPIADNSTGKGRKENRRVELVIFAAQG